MSISSNLYVIAAICGNFWQESQVNPGAWENWTVGDPGFGLGQWTDNPPIVMRRTALFQWLSDHGYTRQDGEGQLQFLVYEDVWIPSLFQQSAYNTLTEFFQSTSTNLSDLVLEWMHHWEGINDSSYQNRYAFASLALSAFQNDSGVRQPWTSGNYRITQQEALDNSMLIKDFFMGSGPVPPRPDEPTEEEILAIVRMALKRRKKGGGVIVF